MQQQKNSAKYGKKTVKTDTGKKLEKEFEKAVVKLTFSDLN